VRQISNNLASAFLQVVGLKGLQQRTKELVPKSEVSLAHEGEVGMHTATRRHFPISAGILFGLGLGGFFDGIILHQVLRWHHMLSSWYPLNSIQSYELNTLWDGIFHSFTYLFVVGGLYVLWQTAQLRHLFWSSKLLVGTILIGFGAFNVVEGIVNHHVLGIHHVNEVVSPASRFYFDAGFIIWGALMLISGWILLGHGRRETETYAAGHRAPKAAR
jgi:uncharacterized membrane protein